MPGTLSQCFRCGSTEIESRPVDEFVRRGSYVVALRFVADVCASCGEKTPGLGRVHDRRRQATAGPGRARWVSRGRRVAGTGRGFDLSPARGDRGAEVVRIRGVETLGGVRVRLSLTDGG